MNGVTPLADWLKTSGRAACRSARSEAGASLRLKRRTLGGRNQAPAAQLLVKPYIISTTEMKALRQLLREFWLPLSLAIAWTAFNMTDKPRSQWDIREALNILTPTFFFISWLVAQWYRVRKQQRVEDELHQIHSGVSAIQEPLLPCSLFLTLRIDATEDHVQRLFSEATITGGYRAYAPEATTPPPIALPPDVQDGRLMLKDSYLDFRDGAVEGGGLFRLDHPGYNEVHAAVRHTFARLAASEASKPRLQSEPLFAPASVQLELFLDGRRPSDGKPASLTLKSGFSAPKVLAAYALDNLIIVDVFVAPLIPAGGRVAASSRSLENAYLKATLNFYYLEGIRTYPETSWPALQNFQLWLGENGRQLLTFDTEKLKGQVVRQNPDSGVPKGTGSPQILFEYEITSSVFQQCLLSAS
jgi:hypothetical protein